MSAENPACEPQREGMMGYIDRILQPGEQRLYAGKIHWVIYLPGVTLALLACVLWLFAATRASDGGLTTVWRLAAVLFAVLAAAALVWAWFNAWTTEIQITDRRIIYKEGFVRRRTREMNMDKVESVDVDQSVLGRIFDYGDITVRGTGESQEPFKMVAAPLEFRNHVTAR
jgi:uncharacterized membrane protein YdbT with pleckstrin-like domain